MNWQESLEKFRVWLDGERSDEAAENIRSAHQNKSESEVFLQKLLNSIEELLEKEIIRIPNTNKAYVPEKVLVFLSTQIDKNFNEVKRQFFEQSLSVLIFERAKEMAGNLDLTAPKIVVEILVNAGLYDNEIEVRVGANDDSTIQDVAPFNPPGTIESDKTLEERGTIDDFDTFMGILFRIEIWQAGKKLSEIPVVQRRIIIGRDDAHKIGHLRLPTENRKISRTHAELEMDENDRVWVTALHKNPVIVDGQVLRNGEKTALGEDGEIQIYDFILKLEFEEQ